MHQLHNLDATALADLVRRKELQPVELVDAAIARIDSINPEINAVVTPLFEHARELAQAEFRQIVERAPEGSEVYREAREQLAKAN